MSKLLVLGAGMMGTALVWPLVDAGHEVTLVGTHLDEELMASVTRRRWHPTLGLELPPEVRAASLAELPALLRDVDGVALGVSSPGVRWAAAQLGPYLRPGQPVFMITKGLEFEEGGLCCLPDLLARLLPVRTAPVAIAGPCIAGELARRRETMVVLTGRDAAVLQQVGAWLATPYYHPRLSSDVLGVECCAALKNAYALGVALGVGLHERRGGSPGSIAQHNLESAIFAQSLAEMQRVVQLMGGEPRSVAGLAGAGDLDVTCNGGRTGRFGRWLGLGVGRERAIAEMQGATLECLDILEVMRSAITAWRGAGLLTEAELPLLRHLAAVALDDAPVDVPLAEFFA